MQVCQVLASSSLQFLRRILAEIVNFHFSHYKSMGTISCHSNQSSYPTGIKNTTYVEANVLSIYAKFRLHPPYSF